MNSKISLLLVSVSLLPVSSHAEINTTAFYTSFSCSAYIIGEEKLYSSEITDSSLIEWIESDVPHDCEASSENITFSQVVSKEDACILVNADPVDAVIVHSKIDNPVMLTNFKNNYCS